MHLTSTIDVIVLIEGNVRSVPDEEETVLKRVAPGYWASNEPRPQDAPIFHSSTKAN
jgi:hypothetical protein